MSGKRTRRGSTWRFLLGQVYRGFSVGRALMHARVNSEVSLRGVVVDVGGGSRQTYLAFMDVSAADRFYVVDLRPGPGVDIVATASSLPLRAESVDTVLCFNVLEHVFDHREAIAGIACAMKPGAVLYGWVPFLIGVHADPEDYYRYTGTALAALLAECGLNTVRIENCGDVFLATFDLLRPYLSGRIVGRASRVVAFCLALVLRRTFGVVRRMPGYAAPVPSASPCGIWFVAERDIRAMIVQGTP